MTTNPVKYWQQGDVLLVSVSELPSGVTAVKPEQNGDVVLQHGETTGHMHRFLGTELAASNASVQMFTSTIPTSGATNVGNITELGDTKRYIVIGDTVLLRHEEHNPISMPPGIYEIDIVREFDYESHEMRRVVD